MAYLLGDDKTIASHVINNKFIDGAQRLEIYANGYRLRLKETLAVDHDVLASYMGDEAFANLADRYIDACPSNQKSLRHFAQRLPEFLAEHYSDYPQLAEIARFERALLFSFDAPDKPPLAGDFLQRLAPQDWPSCQFSWHPSLHLFTCQYNSVSIWQSLKQEQTPPAPIEQPGIWAVWRNQERLTQFYSLIGSELSILQALANGENLSHACGAFTGVYARRRNPQFFAKPFAKLY